MSRTRWLRSRLSVVTLMALVFSTLPWIPSALATTGITTVTFDYTGAAQSWTVPSDVQGGQLLVDVLGAQGGNCSGSGGGEGGSAKGLLSVTASDLLRIYVGGQGTALAGGFNGGGGEYGNGWGGGGGSDIRVGGTALADRAIVAGGGGGCIAVFSQSWNFYAGGHGGGAVGGNGSGSDPGFGGTQTSGGLKGSGTGSNGTDGSLGAGGYATGTGDVAGGGGGYYGGGSGSGGSGGGGSGYTGPLITDGSMTNGVRTGHGVVTISYQHATTASLISPAADTVWNTSTAQQFAVSASDPQGDDFHALVEVEDLDTGATRTITSVRTASGSTATVVPVPPLPAGNYRWRAYACDYPSAPWRPGCSPLFTPWRNLTVLGNLPAEITSMVAPGDAITWSTSDAQSFAAQASDPDGDRFVAKFEVVPSTAAFDSSAETEFYSGLTNNNGVATASPPQRFGVGTYKWRVVALDTGSGRPGGVSATRTFTVAAAPPPAVNQPPATPTLVSPANGHTFLSSDAQQFVVTTTDPEGDAYRADYELTHQSGVVITFSSPSTASGAQATAQAPIKLPSGNYSWRAKARPASGTGFSSDWSSTRTFTVAPAGANTSPNSPTLVSPADNHVYTSSATQTFTVKAVDPDGDIYRAQIEVEKRDALNNLVGFWVFETPPALSDTETSAVLNEKLGTGSYQWRARAVDDAGSGQYGAASVWRAFTVS